MFSLDFLFHMYFLVRYCRLLEEGSYQGRTADFVFMLFLGAVIMTILAPFINVHFLGSSLTFMMVYIWGQHNPHMRMSFLGLFPFTAPYLPWVLFSFSVMLGNSATIDLVGIAVGHTYFYLEQVLPKIAEARGWRMKKFIYTPKFLHYLLDPPDEVQELVVTSDEEEEDTVDDRNQHRGFRLQENLNHPGADDDNITYASANENESKNDFSENERLSAAEENYDGNIPPAFSVDNDEDEKVGESGLRNRGHLAQAAAVDPVH
eukprot:g6101.t1